MKNSSTEREATRYPEDALATRRDQDVIPWPEFASLPAMFRERVRRSPSAVAYQNYDPEQGQWKDYTWTEVAYAVGLWQAALSDEGIRAGDKVAMLLRNSRHWVICDQAVLGLAAVDVPLYINDRAEGIAFVIKHAQARILILDTTQQWQTLREVHDELSELRRVVIIDGPVREDDERVVALDDWLPEYGALRSDESDPDGLASIVYTSGTTGKPKGVMLSHTNMLSNAYMGIQSVAISPQDSFLSFLPLSHMLERTVGQYIPMLAGASVAHARSIADLADDLKSIRPTVLIAVPRIYERIYGRVRSVLEKAPAWRRGLFNLAVRVGWRRFKHKQGRASWHPLLWLWPLLNLVAGRRIRDIFGGRLTGSIVGGAPLPPTVGKVFNGLGVTIMQGYGLTETSPVLTTNTLEHNIPTSIGLPLNGVQLRVGEDDELLAKGPCVMLGYWKNEQATRNSFTQDGWLRTGDRARIENGYVYIIGRLKDILVLGNGEKVPPADMEAAIEEDSLFDQSMVIGEGMPYLTALLVLNPDKWQSLAQELSVSADDATVLKSKEVEQALAQRIAKLIVDFPGYANIYRVAASLDPWTVENELLTATLKLKRPKILQHFRADIDRLYEGHYIDRAASA